MATDAAALEHLLADAAAAGNAAAALLADPTADLEQALALATRRETALAVAAELLRAHPDIRTDAVSQRLVALIRQQATLANAGERRREQLLADLETVRQAAVNLRQEQSGARAAAAPQLLDRRG